jgi:hypothetical protein
MSTPQPGEGWYASEYPGYERWWDGVNWTGATRAAAVPVASTAQTAGVLERNKVLLRLALTLAVIGFAVQFRTISLNDGDSIYWVGAGLALVATVVVVALRGRLWMRWVAFILVALCISNVFYAEHQLDLKRQEIQQLLNSP